MANPTITPIMTPASGPGDPYAKPVYIVDVYGNPLTGSGSGLPVTITNVNANGQATMVNSAPVTIASDQSPVKTKGDFLIIAGAGIGVVTGINTFFIPSTDVSAYKTVTIQATGTSTLTLIFEVSSDNANFVPYMLTRVDTASANQANTSIVSAGSQNVVYSGPVVAQWFRVRCSAFTSNTSLAGNLNLSTSPSAVLLTNLLTIQSGVWTMQPGNTQNTTPWLVQGPTTTGTQAANTAGNVVIKGTPGALWTATITTLGTAGLLVYDNASTNSGTILLSIPASAAVGTIYSWFLGQPAANGITSAGVVNCPAVTFGFR